MRVALLPRMEATHSFKDLQIQRLSRNRSLVPPERSNPLHPARGAFAQLRHLARGLSVGIRTPGCILGGFRQEITLVRDAAGIDHLGRKYAASAPRLQKYAHLARAMLIRTQAKCAATQYWQLGALGA